MKTSFLPYEALLGQSNSSFDFRQLLDERKILLCDLSKGSLGPDVTSLLGSLVVTKLALAALSRQDTLEEERTPHFLYADEVQNFVYGVDLPTILAESRKYRLALIMATQTLSLLPELTLAAVLGNCATIASFRVSGADAEILEREILEREFAAHAGARSQDWPGSRGRARHRCQHAALRPTTSYRGSQTQGLLIHSSEGGKSTSDAGYQGTSLRMPARRSTASMRRDSTFSSAFTLHFRSRFQQPAHFFFEADRGTMSAADMLKKLRGYYHFIKK